jgi:DNA-binding IclR family transcriptional regulator
MAALSVSVPIQRLSPEQAVVYGNKLQEVSLMISQKLGFLVE